MLERRLSNNFRWGLLFWAGVLLGPVARAFLDFGIGTSHNFQIAIDILGLAMLGIYFSAVFTKKAAFMGPGITSVEKRWTFGFAIVYLILSVASLWFKP